VNAVQVLERAERPSDRASLVSGLVLVYVGTLTAQGFASLPNVTCIERGADPCDWILQLPTLLGLLVAFVGLCVLLYRIPGRGRSRHMTPGNVGVILLIGITVGALGLMATHFIPSQVCAPGPPGGGPDLLICRPRSNPFKVAMVLSWLVVGPGFAVWALVRDKWWALIA
jgi:hypothetical protein